MSLSSEISLARRDIVTDGYDMSIGELINLYSNRELVVNPDYQRLFRWDLARQSNFIESILLGLPTPPIFVFQNSDGAWELIDGLQRVSTILKFVGLIEPPSSLVATKFLPSLSGKTWSRAVDENGEDTSIGTSLQLQIKRSRIRVEILRQESDPLSKYELFIRLNTGGDLLSQQEVRNCIGYMLKPSFQEWIVQLSDHPSFYMTNGQADSSIEKSLHIELVLRFLAFRNYTYLPSKDVHTYLDESLLKLIGESEGFLHQERMIFEKTFDLIEESFSVDAFKKFDGVSFAGRFMHSIYEVVTVGISSNIDAIEKMPNRIDFITDKVKNLSKESDYLLNSGSGISGSKRIAKLIPFAREYFAR